MSDLLSRGRRQINEPGTSRVFEKLDPRQRLCRFPPDSAEHLCVVCTRPVRPALDPVRRLAETFGDRLEYLGCLQCDRARAAASGTGDSGGIAEQNDSERGSLLGRSADWTSRPRCGTSLSGAACVGWELHRPTVELARNESADSERTCRCGPGDPDDAPSRRHARRPSCHRRLLCRLSLEPARHCRESR